jgi:hypothetical protein
MGSARPAAIRIARHGTGAGSASICRILASAEGDRPPASATIARGVHRLRSARSPQMRETPWTSPPICVSAVALRSTISGLVAAPPVSTPPQHPRA